MPRRQHPHSLNFCQVRQANGVDLLGLHGAEPAAKGARQSLAGRGGEVRTREAEEIDGDQFTSPCADGP
jgi:hypothetical protein